MKRLVKKISVVLVNTLVISMLSGCVNQHPDTAQGSEETRIVATSVAVCEVLDALEVDDVVGVPETSAYTIPDRFQEATLIGSPMAPDMEIVSSLDPTLILSPASLEGDLASQYEEIGVDSAFLNLTSVQGMYKSIEELGELLDREEQANTLVEEFETYMKEYQVENEGKDAPTVLILMGLPGSYVVATENSYVGSLVELAGGINVYEGQSEEGFMNVNTEDMLEKQPDIILRTSHALPEQVQAMFEEEFSTNEIWQHFDAVTSGQVYDLDNNLFGMSANFDYPDALAKLQEIFYE